MRHPVSISDKREQEKQIVALMIHLYCHRRHSMPKGQLCPDCEALLSYAQLRSDKCPFSGPRMLLVHPVMAIRHMICSMKEKKIMKERKS